MSHAGKDGGAGEDVAPLRARLCVTAGLAGEPTIFGAVVDGVVARRRLVVGVVVRTEVRRRRSGALAFVVRRFTRRDFFALATIYEFGISRD